MSNEFIKPNAFTNVFSGLSKSLDEIKTSLKEIVSQIQNIIESLKTIKPKEIISIEDFAGIAAGAITLVGVAIAYATGIGEIATVVAAAIALVAAQASFVISNWGPISEFFTNLWNEIAVGSQIACDWIVDAVSDMIVWICDIISPIVTWINNNIIPPIIKAFAWAWENISNAVGVFIGFVSDISLFLYSWLEGVIRMV